MTPMHPAHVSQPLAAQVHGRSRVCIWLCNRNTQVIGRDEEIRRCVRVLCRRTKNNPVLIGEPGVGKTAIVEGLAQRVVSARAYRICVWQHAAGWMLYSWRLHELVDLALQLLLQVIQFQ